jgi:photosystem II stability/assembly factor-like uncharacterized protein
MMTTGPLRLATIAGAILVLTLALSARLARAQSSAPSQRSSSEFEATGEIEQRALYRARLHGLQFGFPKRAFVNAIETTELMQALSAPAWPQAAAPLQWMFIGPQPMLGQEANFGGAVFGSKFSATGRISALAVDPSGNIFVGAASGGVWLSTDKGATFKPISAGFPTQSIGSLAIDSFNTNPPTVYAGTGEGNNSLDSLYGQGLFRSNNFSQPWQQVGKAKFDAFDPRQSFTTAASRCGLIFVGTGYGGSLSRGSSYLQESSGGNIYESIDGGNTWNNTFRSTKGPIRSFSVGAAVNPDTGIKTPAIYATADMDGVYRAFFDCVGTRHLSHWDKLPAPLIANNLFRLSVAADTNERVYVIAGAANGHEYQGFFESTTGGETWGTRTVPSYCATPTCLVNGIRLDGNKEGNYSNNFYDQTLIISPSDSDTVYFGGVGIYKSTNGGGSWKFIAPGGGTHADQHALAFSGNDLLVGNDGGLFKYNDASGAWTALNDQISAGQIQAIGPHPLDSSRLLAGFQDNGTQLRSGSGLGWRFAETGDGGFVQFDQRNPLFAYHTFATVTGGPVLGVSTDGGLSWDSSTPTSAIRDAIGCTSSGCPAAGGGPPQFYPPLAADPGNARRVLFGNRTIYVSTDGMLTWDRQTTRDMNLGCTAGYCALTDIEFAPSDHTRAWAVASLGPTIRVFNTTQAQVNSNAVWVERTGKLPFNTSGTQVTGIGVSPVDPAVAYLSLSGFTSVTHIGHVFRTTNFGDSWQRADGVPPLSAIPDIPVLKTLVDASSPTSSILLAGTDIGIFRSVDAGQNWQPFNLIIPHVPVYDLAQNRKGVIFAATHGRGAYVLQGSGGATPTPTRTPTRTPTKTPTRTPTKTPTRTPTKTRLARQPKPRPERRPAHRLRSERPRARQLVPQRRHPESS